MLLPALKVRLEDAEAMQKTHPTSPRFRLWMAGFLILAGTLVLVASIWYQTDWYQQESGSCYYTIADYSYWGLLSATNQSVVIPLTEVTPTAEVRVTSLWSGYTPLTVTLRDWNNSIALQLLNYTAYRAGECEIAVRSGLAHPWYAGTPTLTLERVSADVWFNLNLTIGDWTIPPPITPPYGVVGLGTILGVALIGTGFGLLEGVVSGIRRGRF
jgi:hypothetical protein